MDADHRLSPRERIRSDLRLAQATARAAPTLARNRPGASTTMAERFEEVLHARPDRVAIIDAFDGGREVTCAELEEQANRTAHWAAAQGIGQGSVVALFMHNRPEYVATWLGLAKLGATTAPSTPTSPAIPLRHSIRVSGAGHLIVDRELAPHWISPRRRPARWATHLGVVHGPGPGARRLLAHSASGENDLDAALRTQPYHAPYPSAREGLVNTDPLFYIYTSGPPACRKRPGSAT
ncbi:MAG: AMP-binding protein [Acidimicrobiales bacterium]